MLRAGPAQHVEQFLNNLAGVLIRQVMAHIKPVPGLFLAVARLGVGARDAFVVGDSVWDLLAAGRAGAIEIGLCRRVGRDVMG
jgi:phosphoglycolate phosphatase-like HAD superfamily hydrolase